MERIYKEIQSYVENEGKSIEKLENVFINLINNNYSEALTLITKIITDNPNSKPLFFIKSFLNYKEYEFDSAIEDLSEIIELYDYDSFIIKSRAFIYLDVGLNESYKKDISKIEKQNDKYNKDSVFEREFDFINFIENLLSNTKFKNFKIKEVENSGILEKKIDEKILEFYPIKSLPSDFFFPFLPSTVRIFVDIKSNISSSNLMLDDSINNIWAHADQYEDSSSLYLKALEELHNENFTQSNEDLDNAIEAFGKNFKPEGLDNHFKDCNCLFHKVSIDHIKISDCYKLKILLNSYQWNQDTDIVHENIKKLRVVEDGFFCDFFEGLIYTFSDKKDYEKALLKFENCSKEMVVPDGIDELYTDCLAKFGLRYDEPLDEKALKQDLLQLKNFKEFLNNLITDINQLIDKRTKEKEQNQKDIEALLEDLEIIDSLEDEEKIKTVETNENIETMEERIDRELKELTIQKIKERENEKNKINTLPEINIEELDHKEAMRLAKEYMHHYRMYKREITEETKKEFHHSLSHYIKPLIPHSVALNNDDFKRSEYERIDKPFFYDEENEFIFFKGFIAGLYNSSGQFNRLGQSLVTKAYDDMFLYSSIHEISNDLAFISIATNQLEKIFEHYKINDFFHGINYRNYKNQSNKDKNINIMNNIEKFILENILSSEYKEIEIDNEDFSHTGWSLIDNKHKADRSNISSKNNQTDQDTKWLDIVIKAMDNLPDNPNLAQIYLETKKIRKNKGLSIPPSTEAIIRRELETNSSDSDAWNGKNDIFTNSDKGSGIWNLRKIKNNIKESDTTIKKNKIIDEIMKAIDYWDNEDKLQYKIILKKLTLEKLELEYEKRIIKFLDKKYY
ncbi:MAG: hypothetical protein CMG57_09105 [Candidatus Marinimicrobia bacterium]|nr:hypothetical protein [Candidatus Neomarinimicrobiota bacterium]|tara:strand:- start:1973 stop:4528 length:2556 start_codon:yes stop_codon:yes gene_type:complete